MCACQYVIANTAVTTSGDIFFKLLIQCISIGVLPFNTYTVRNLSNTLVEALCSAVVWKPWSSFVIYLLEKKMSLKMRAQKTRFFFAFLFYNVGKVFCIKFSSTLNSQCLFLFEHLFFPLVNKNSCQEENIIQRKWHHC